MYYGYDISDKIAAMAVQAEADCKEVFAKIEENVLICSAKVLSAFQECMVSTADFIEVTGYGFTDSGRDKLEKIYAKVFGAEDALVRPQLMSGTHALAVTLGGLCKPGDTLLYITGTPYDTLQTVIGTAGESRNSLMAYGVKYDEVDLLGDDFDIEASRDSQPPPLRWRQFSVAVAMHRERALPLTRSREPSRRSRRSPPRPLLWLTTATASSPRTESPPTLAQTFSSAL